MELAEILSARAVIADAQVASKSELLELIAERAAEVGSLNAATVLEALENREALGSTGLGNGIAIPHGKLAGLGSVMAVFVRLEQPIDFDAVDDLPVDLVMMLLAPFGAGADHLKALARVARLLRTESLADDLRRTANATRLYDMLTAPVASTYAA